MASNTKSKGDSHREKRDMRPKAHLRHVRISSRKAAPVINLIRGKSVEDARAILKFTPKAASPILLKLLESAVANAVNNLDMDVSTLYVAEAYANQGPTMKRYIPRSRGSAAPILKRTSHFSIVLDSKQEEK
ncbi:MAG: 50S ribosomal protein L22 [Christensenellales bacterium]|jgi:large subunit ribosomal protein L22|nr:50S ribosomal protein L22 [Christensenellaceae bacterium]